MKSTVYEVSLGHPIWSRLYTCSLEAVSSYSLRFLHKSVVKDESIRSLRSYFCSELPSSILREVLQVCLIKDKFRCHHNPTECLALELWRVFYDSKFKDVNVTHHEFAFPKTTNYPDIVRNLDQFLRLLLIEPSLPTVSSFKLELKQCEIGFLVQDRIVQTFQYLSDGIRVLEIPGLGTDHLLHVISVHCTNLEYLNVRGSRKQITDHGFIRFIRQVSNKSSFGSSLKRLDVSRCALSNQIFFALQSLTQLTKLNISTTLLVDIQYSCEGQAILQEFESGETLRLDKIGLPSVTQISVEHENILQVSINKVMMYLRNIFPNAKNIHLENCIACELHFTLTQQPVNIGFMRENIQSLELISADYFRFPRLVYPCPNLEKLSIEKPTNGIFNVDLENVPFLYGNTVPFINLRNLKLSRISLTNLTHFLSKSSNLRKFKVSNIGRRERPQWTDERVRQILSPTSIPLLEEVHVSCLPNEGFSTSENHRYLHLTKETIAYLTRNFPHLKRISGIESWNPRESSRASLSTVLMDERVSQRFFITSL